MGGISAFVIMIFAYPGNVLNRSAHDNPGPDICKKMQTYAQRIRLVTL